MKQLYLEKYGSKLTIDDMISLNSPWGKMGVKDLWGLLEPACSHKPLADLQGQVLAVDLSIWIVEVQSMKKLQGVVIKPHLRNLFFRVSHLTQLGVKLLFVIEGDPPPIKWEIIQKRLQQRTGVTSHKKTMTRPRFKAILRECSEMLDLLGVPYVQSQGEAEAMCALLNKEKVVDAVITNDGDAFLYGAETVYRNFTMNTKDPHVESYSMCTVHHDLGMSRETLVGLALLLGCDYLPQGVPGVGRETVIKLVKELDGQSLLNRFHKWKHSATCSQISPVEANVRRKAMVQSGFPNQEVISEFLVEKDKVPSSLSTYKRPELFKLKDFLVQKLEWESEYSFEKVLPLITLHDLRTISLLGRENYPPFLHPDSIVKKRVRKGVNCLEIKWNKHALDSSENEFYTTIEEEALFTSCFPSLLEDYEVMKAAKTKKSKVPKAKKKQTKLSEMDAKIALTANELHSMTIGDLPSMSIPEDNSFILPKKIDRPRISHDIMPVNVDTSVEGHFEEENTDIPSLSDPVFLSPLSSEHHDSFLLRSTLDKSPEKDLSSGCFNKDSPLSCGPIENSNQSSISPPKAFNLSDVSAEDDDLFSSCLSADDIRSDCDVSLRKMSIKEKHVEPPRNLCRLPTDTAPSCSDALVKTPENEERHLVSLDDSDLPEITPMGIRRKKRHAKKGLEILAELRKTYTLLSSQSEVKENETLTPANFNGNFSIESSLLNNDNLSTDLKDSSHIDHAVEMPVNDVFEASPAGEEKNWSGRDIVETSMSDFFSISAAEDERDIAEISIASNVLGISTSDEKNNSSKEHFERLSLSDIVAMTAAQEDSDSEDSILFMQSQIPLAQRLKMKSK